MRTIVLINNLMLRQLPIEAFMRSYLLLIATTVLYSVEKSTEKKDLYKPLKGKLLFPVPDIIMEEKS